jgi:thiol reductant ABC exporter CydD subunit
MKALDPRLLRHAGGTRRYVAVSVITAVGSGATFVVAAFAISELVVRPFQHGAGRAELRGPLTVLAAAVVCRALLAWAGQVAAHRAAADVKSRLRHGVLESTVRLGPSWLARRNAGELATLTTSGIDAMDGYFAQYLPALGTAAVLPLGVTVVVLSQDPVSGLIILVTLPLIPFFAILIGQGTEDATRRQWRTLAVLGGHFLDVVAGLPTLLLFGRARAQVDRMRETAEDNRRATMRTLRQAFLSSAVLEFIATISVALVAVSIGLRLVSGRLDLATGLVVLMLAPEAYWPLRQVGAQFHASAEGLAAAETMIAVIEEPGPRDGSPSVRTIDLARTTLRVEGLTVRYDRDRPALAGVDLVVRPGEYVTIAGPSGCGKTTLLWTLLGFVAPTAGRVLLDGPHGPVDLADVDPDLWRAQIAWVPQEPWLAPASVADNVRLARPDASPAAVSRALRMAHAAQFVDALPAGSATVLGENGAELSAGQRQRIALARAFLRDAPLVLLDEPTAHLDPVSETAVARAVRHLARNRTVIAVAHRPALLAAGDRVVHLTLWPERASA